MLQISISLNCCVRKDPKSYLLILAQFGQGSGVGVALLAVWCDQRSSCACIQLGVLLGASVQYGLQMSDSSALGDWDS